MKNALHNVLCAFCAAFYLVTFSCVGIHSCRTEGTAAVVFLIGHDCCEEDDIHHEAGEHHHHDGCCSTEIVELLSAQDTNNEDGRLSAPVPVICPNLLLAGLTEIQPRRSNNQYFYKELLPDSGIPHFRPLLM